MFFRQTDQLAGYEKGNVISVSGTMQVSQWTGQNGETRQGWQVIADSVISARSVRPGGKRGQQGKATEVLERAKRQTGQQGNQPPAGGDDPFSDDIPF